LKEKGRENVISEQILKWAGTQSEPELGKTAGGFNINQKEYQYGKQNNIIRFGRF